MPYFRFSDSWEVYREVIVQAADEDDAREKLFTGEGWLYEESWDGDVTGGWDLEDESAEPFQEIAHLAKKEE